MGIGSNVRPWTRCEESRKTKSTRGNQVYVAAIFMTQLLQDSADSFTTEEFPHPQHEWRNVAQLARGGGHVQLGEGKSRKFRQCVRKVFPWFLLGESLQILFTSFHPPAP